jgi:hypothetical protein
MMKTAVTRQHTASADARQASPSAARPLFIQRTVAGPSAEHSHDPSELVAGTLASHAAPLDRQTRAFMEPRFGQDFSSVRVHADPSAARAARALNARAFTAGEHIIFGAGQHAPASAAGRRIMAHELAHVVQQRSGIVSGKPQPNGLWVNDPADRFEHTAESVASAVMAHRPGTTPATRATHSRAGSGPSSPKTIQRFLAGEAGDLEAHGGIEEGGLEQAGLSHDEAREAYSGNWLRDFSQIPDESAPNDDAMLEIVRILYTGEFGHAPGDSEIGRYLASEHVDNPEGGGSAENPHPDADPKIDAKTRAAHQADRVRALSPSQKAWFKEEQTEKFRNDIRAKADASGLPAYIEVAKEHVRRQVSEAAALGRNQRGLAALGNGLHAVEDYFAHSNFVEVALAELKREGEVGETNPKVRATKGYVGIDDPANLGSDKFERPQIVTGTSAHGAGDTVGRWEALKRDLRNHEFRQYFLRGAVLRYGRDAGTTLIGGILGGVIGAAGSIGGIVTGAARGAAAGWRGAHHWWSKPLAALGGLGLGALKGLASGAASGFKTGMKIGGRIGGTAPGRWFNRLIGFGLAPAVATVVASILAAITAGGPIFGLTETHAKSAIAKGTRATVTEGKAPLPSHSQIAKDDIDHPLHAAAATLARVADREIGRQMIKVWASQGDARKDALAAALKLVDVYMAHPMARDETRPQADPWWKADLLSVVKTPR